MQLGEATPGGCEAAIHATRRARSYMATMSDDSVLVKLDFNNAFMSPQRPRAEDYSNLAGQMPVLLVSNGNATTLGFEDSSLHSCPKKIRRKHGWRQEHGRYGHDQTTFSSTMATNGLFISLF